MKRKRRWLWCVLAASVLAGVVCAIVFWPVYRRAEKQRQAVNWIRENGGGIMYDHQYDEDGQIDIGRAPPGPAWLRDIVGIHYFADPYAVHLDSEEVTDISPLANLTKLGRLGLPSPAVQDVSPLANLTDLTYLNLSDSQVEDVTPLATLTGLTVLLMDRTQVADVTPLAKLTNLKKLSLHATQVEDIRPLASLKDLEELTLSETNVRDVDSLAGLRNLQSLSLNKAPIEDPTSLTKLIHVRQMYLFGVEMTREQFEAIEEALPECQIYSTPR